MPDAAAPSSDSPPSSDFVHLHVHSDFSLLDGACRIDRLVARVRALGMGAVAVTDHGNLFGTVNFYRAAKEAGIKPLLGCEVYLVEGSRTDKSRAPEGEKGYFHLGLIARDATGYANLVKLVSDAHLHGFYYKPRTDWEMLARHAGGLVAFSGCLAAMVPQCLLRGDYEAARRATARFVDLFTREYFVIELQDHGIPEQARIHRDLVRLAREFNLRVVATNDVHYVDAADAGPHDTMLCIQTGARIGDTDRMRFDTQEFYLKSEAQMRDRFRELPEAITNTRAVAELCDVDISFPKGSERYPRYPLPPEVSTDRPGYLRDLCRSGLRQRYGVDEAAVATDPVLASRLELLRVPPGRKPQPPDYSGLDLPRELVLRTAYEVAIIEVTGFVDYFLIVWDFIAWAKQRGIPVGPGRGSGAGCLVAYLLGITDIDPIRFKLLFERFLNPERVSPPDFDIDFCMRRRGEVIDYVRSKYGADRVANIVTFGTLGAKLAIRDVARVNNLPFGEADRLAKMVPDELNIELSAAVAKSQELRDEMARNESSRRVVEQALVLEGMVRNTGKHAAGIIITDRPLDEFVPLTLQEGDVTVQFDMNAVGKLGLLKMDFLGLKTLTVLADAVEHVRATVDRRFSLEDLPLDDPRTFTLLNAGRTIGVFQLESSGMQSACKQVGVSTIDDINAICALYRPGPMAFIPDYARGKRDPATIAFPHPLLEPILRETNGIIVYQEQVMECAKVVAGYTLGGADMLRRAMGKKDADAMAKERVKFVAGAAASHGISESKANEVFDLLNKFASYGFNKSHSAAYALLSYRTAFLKANHPVQFMAAVLSNEQGDADKVSHFIAEARAIGLSVLGPDINESGNTFTPVVDRSNPLAGAIRFGLAGIKGVGDHASQAIVEERSRSGHFRSFDDLLSRCDGRAVNKRVLENLIKTGAFDSLGEDRATLLAGLDEAMSAAASLQRDRALGQASLFDLLGDAGTPASTLGARARAPNTSAPSRAGQLSSERELLGFYLSGHPLDQFAELADAATTCEPNELLSLPDRSLFRVAGLVSGIAKKLSKKDNRPWAAFTLSTRKSSATLNLFADGYADFGQHLAEEAPVLVIGTISTRNGEVRAQVDDLTPLAPALPGLFRRAILVLRPGPAADAFLPRLREFIDAHRGSVEVAIALPADGDRLILCELPGSLSIQLAPAAFASLRDDPAVSSVLLESRPPQPTERRRWRKSA